MRLSTLLGFVFVLIIMFLLAWREVKAEGFYLEPEISVRKQSSHMNTQAHEVDGQTRYLTDFKLYDVNVTSNPYGGLSLGYVKSFKVLSIPVDIDAHLRHDSSLSTTQDHGINSFNVGVRIWLFQ